MSAPTENQSDAQKQERDSLSAAPDPTARASRRSRLYGRSRANRWPLWTAWLLAPNAAARERVRTLMQIRERRS